MISYFPSYFDRGISVNVISNLIYLGISGGRRRVVNKIWDLLEKEKGDNSAKTVVNRVLSCLRTVQTWQQWNQSGVET